MLGRRDRKPEGSATTTLVGAATGPGKNRATPSRREAEAARKQRLNPSLSRRDAARLRREEARSQRLARVEGMRRGDERYLLPRDRGPVPRALRDLVDARRNVGDLFLPLVLIVFVLSLAGARQTWSLYVNAVLYGVTLLLVLDSFLLARRAGRFVRATFPGETGAKAGRYAVLRAMQFRRLRQPAPQVPSPWSFRQG